MQGITARTFPSMTDLAYLMAEASHRIHRVGVPVLQLAIRLWMARIFFLSGLTKIRDWDSTLFLFQTDYSLPVAPPALAATLATTFELTMPVLLVLGLFSRLAALPLFGMAVVIQFVLGVANPAFNSVQHIYWMFLLATIAVHGPGPLSLDYLIQRWVRAAVA